jgi:hypothetical protein
MVTGNKSITITTRIVLKNLVDYETRWSQRSGKKFQN